MPPRRNPTPLPRTPLQDGFSLIELLAAIAIVSILGALVTVSLQNIRNSSQLAKSISIIRQFQGANSLYALEHSGRYVPVRTISEEGTIKRWLDQHEFKEHLGIQMGEEWPLGLISPNAGVLDDDGRPRFTRSYGMNTLGFSDWFNVEADYQASISTIEDPANIIAFTDALDWIVGPQGIERWPGEEVYAKQAVAFRYGGKATVVFYDGHTGAYTQEEMTEHKKEWWKIDK
ncbi:MAG: type II secretion system protein [Verrucomicrobiota bacterium JB024]|nr:type II secretion system protein [Verrucomicrobiota bacterium JB024]